MILKIFYASGSSQEKLSLYLLRLPLLQLKGPTKATTKNLKAEMEVCLETLNS